MYILTAYKIVFKVICINICSTRHINLSRRRCNMQYMYIKYTVFLHIQYIVYTVNISVKMYTSTYICMYCIFIYGIYGVYLNLVNTVYTTCSILYTVDVLYGDNYLYSNTCTFILLY